MNFEGGGKMQYRVMYYENCEDRQIVGSVVISADDEKDAEMKFNDQIVNKLKRRVIFEIASEGVL